MKSKCAWAGFIVLAVALCAFVFFRPQLAVIHAGVSRRVSPKTVEARVQQFGDTVRARLAPDFKRAVVAYPPAAVTLIGLKHERVLEVHAAGADGRFRFIRAYPILAASGVTGPKLREGDRQVPEGLYRVESLNPNSLYHLALRVSYPNEFDRTQAAAEGRTNLGGDIMIHGNSVSIGCLAMGDQAAEELFVLAARTGLGNVQVVLSPVDFRTRDLPATMSPLPPWTAQLYTALRKSLARYEVPAVRP